VVLLRCVRELNGKHGLGESGLGADFLRFAEINHTLKHG
jgi:hypothetical protein